MVRSLLAVLLLLLTAPAAAAQTVAYPSPAVLPSSATVNLGSSASTGTLCSVANVNTTSASTTGTSEETLATYSLPANTLATNGAFVHIRAWYTGAANGNNKTESLYFGSTLVVQRGPQTDNAGTFWQDAVVVRTGASAQEAIGIGLHQNSGGVGNSDARRTTPAEDTTAAISITARATTPTVAGDVTFRGMIVMVCNK